MKRACIAAVFGLVLLVTAVLPGCKGAGQSGPTKRVLVFGIDGGTWVVLDELLQGGELPNLRKLYDSGIHGVLESRPPALSPVVWSTIFTGRLPDEHGVENWKTSQSTNRKVKAVWEITTDAGLATDVFNVPSTWPAEEVKGVMLSGFPLSGSTIGGNTGEVLKKNDLTARTTPSCYQQNADSLRQTMDGLAVGQWSPYVDIQIRGRPSWKAAVRVLRLDEEKYYLSPCYRFDDGMKMSFPADIRAEIDERLGEPYIPEGPGWSKHAEEDTPKYLYQHLEQVARNQTRAASMFADKDWNLLIYVDTLVDRVSHPYWAYMQPGEYDGLDRAKAKRYENAVRDAYRETDRQLGELLAATKGEFYTVLASDHGFHANRDRSTYIGTHDFDGIYLVSGPGIQGADGGRVFIEDIAPTVLYLLGLPVAGDMKGSVIPAVEQQLGRPIQTVATYEDGHKTGSDKPVDAKTWQQLCDLGYVDCDKKPKAGETK